MAIFAILSFVLGAMLAHRFKVLVLAPGIGVGAIVAIAIGIARAQDVWLIVVTVMLFSISLQVGYLCGAVVHSLMIGSRALPLKRSV
jgi:hypothetical protein